MDRKTFLKSSGAAALLLSLGINLTSCEDEDNATPSNNNNPSTISFNISNTPYNVLQNDDAWLLHPEKNILVVNVGGNIRAFTSVCTHSGCTRNWTRPSVNFVCNCHGSEFNTSGEVVVGPASSNLQEFQVDVNANVIEIMGTF